MAALIWAMFLSETELGIASQISVEVPFETNVLKSERIRYKELRKVFVTPSNSVLGGVATLFW